MISIAKRQLKIDEINILDRETQNQLHIAHIAPAEWGRYENVFIATDKGELVGICAILELSQWIRLGPIVIVKRFRKKGYGNALLKHVINQLENKNLYIRSTSLVMDKIALKHGFRMIDSFFNLPWEIQKEAITYLFGHLGLPFVYDALKKRVIKGRRRYLYYLKSNISS